MRSVPEAVAVALMTGAAHASCPGQTQLEMNECAAIQYKEADAALNAAWGSAKARFDAVGMGGTLLEAQRQWLVFRDAACTAEADLYKGGSVQPLIWFSCLTRQTIRRTEDLQMVALP